MGQYTSYYKNLNNNQKEAIFRSVLKFQLGINNYVVADPQPDNGDDIWVATAKQRVYFIYPAQIKSSYVITHLRNERVRRFLVNIKQYKLESTFDRKYIYFFGLYDPDFQPANFHIGCVPSSFFQSHWDFLKQKKSNDIKRYQAIQKTRVNIEIDYDVDCQEYFMFMKPSINVTPYFKSFDAIV